MAGTGRPKTGGRKKGVRNRATREAKEALLAMGCNPLEELWKLGQRAVEDDDKPVAATCFKELAQYMHPKLKAIDHTHNTAEGVVFEVNMVGIDPGGK